MDVVYECPWSTWPCAPYLERLLEGINTKPITRKPHEGWIVRRSLKRLEAWKKEQGITENWKLVRYIHQQVPWLDELGITDKQKHKRSRYTAIAYEFICNFEMMEHLTSLKPGGRNALRKLALEGSDVLHFIAVADLYYVATRHLPKETGE